MGQKITAKGGGWYFQEDGTSVQLSKAAIKAGDYEVVKSFDKVEASPKVLDVGPEAEVTISAEADLSGLDDGSNVPMDTGIVVDQFKPLPGSQLPIGPFKDYVYAATPYGEFGIPAGKTIVAFREVLDHQDKRSYRAIYGGEGLSRTEEERLEWINLKESERVKLAEQGRI